MCQVSVSDVTGSEEKNLEFLGFRYELGEETYFLRLVLSRLSHLIELVSANLN